MNKEHLHPDGRPYTKEEFVEKIKTDKSFAKRFGEFGRIYGAQWRSWTNYTGDEIQEGTYEMTNEPIDQIQSLINDLKTNPDSRRMVVNAWAVHDLPKMVLPPCHYGFQVYTRELSWYDDLDKIKEIYINWSLSKPSGGYAGDIKVDITESANQIFVDGWQEHKDPFTGNPLIELECFSSIPKRAISLMWNQRSVDTFLGLPFNIASYGLLLEIIAKEVNMVPDELIANLGDTHLYLNHIEQAKEQIGRTLTVDERMDWWFKNRKPNRDVCDDVDTYSPYAKGVYFDSVGVPKTTREPYPLPTLKINPNNEMRVGGGIFTYVNTDFTLENYQSHPSIKAPLSN